MLKKKSSKMIAVAIGLPLLMAATIIAKIVWLPSSAQYATYTSPDGRYRIDAYIYAGYTNYLLPGGPGDASRGRGFVRLIGPNGKVCGETKVSDVREAAGSKDDVHWAEQYGEVYGGSGDAMFEFKIPKEGGTSR